MVVGKESFVSYRDDLSSYTVVKRLVFSPKANAMQCNAMQAAITTPASELQLTMDHLLFSRVFYAVSISNH